MIRRRPWPFLAVAAGLIFAAGGADAAETTVPTGVEAWYHVTAVQQSGMGAANPYPDDTLHVGVRTGQEESRTYLTLDLRQVPAAASITAGTLTLPVDPEAGTFRPDAARIAVCFVAQPGSSVEGSFDPPPAADCSTSATAEYVAEPSPHFTVDLDAFVVSGSRLRTGGLALLASEEARDEGDTWHVAFYARENASPDAEPITAAVSYELPRTAPRTAERPSGPPPAFNGGPASVGAGPPGPPPPAAPGPSEADLAPASPRLIDAGDLGTDAFVAERTAPNYLSWVLLLPIGLFAFVAYFGRALTFDGERG